MVSHLQLLLYHKVYVGLRVQPQLCFVEIICKKVTHEIKLLFIILAFACLKNKSCSTLEKV